MTGISYDFVIVGGGSAGCALAARLTENKQFSVLLLEAGGEVTNKWVDIPIGIGKLLANPDLLWPFRTEPDTSMHSQTHYWPRGKMLGGSSCINGMLHVRGDRTQYDRWRDAQCPGWGYSDVLPALKRLENRPQGNPAERGHGGPIDVIDVRYKDALTEAFLASCNQIGIDRVDDYNAGSLEGAAYIQVSQRNGRRCTTESAYLRPARSRSNLTVETHARVDRLIFENQHVVGVSYAKGSKRDNTVVKAAREVILCAGALSSPQILERSGVGNPDLIKARGIQPVACVPAVGENMQDHVNVRIGYECKGLTTVNDLLNNRLQGAKAGLEYLLFKRGLMATPTITAHAYMRTDSELTSPDIKLQLAHVTGADRYSMAKGRGIDEFSGFALNTFQLHPESRGSIHIRSSDPDDNPVIHANYLAHENDQKAIVKGLQVLRQLAATDVMKSMIVREVRPGPATADFDELLDFAKATGQTCWHAVATCKMGAQSDSVVDTKLKVYGVSGLRIADASVLPHLVSSNTNVPCVMLGERCAELLAHEYA